MSYLSNKHRGNAPMSLHDAINTMFTGAYLEPFSTFENYSNVSSMHTHFPNIDIADDEHEMLIRLDIPGFNQNDIQVELNNNTLLISGMIEKEKTEGDAEKKFYRRECHSQSFKQNIPLLNNIKEDDINCEYKNGRLTITIPKEKIDEKQKKKILTINKR